MAEAKQTTKKPAAKKATEVKSIADMQNDLASKQADLLESKRSTVLASS